MSHCFLPIFERQPNLILPLSHSQRLSPPVALLLFSNDLSFVLVLSIRINEVKKPPFGHLLHLDSCVYLSMSSLPFVTADLVYFFSFCFGFDDLVIAANNCLLLVDSPVLLYRVYVCAFPVSRFWLTGWRNDWQTVVELELPTTKTTTNTIIDDYKLL